MTADFLIHAVLGLLPVICFLGGLVYLDSYRLVGIRWVLGTIATGGLIAGLSYFLNGWLIGLLDIEFTTYSRYLAPFVEEVLKGAVILALIRLHRIGFLVDAAIFGFAVGAGFSVVENIYFLQVLPDTSTGVWIVRGFGTAIMHGGATAIFAVAGRALISQRKDLGAAAWLPGLIIAAIIHSIFNHFFFSPMLTTLGVLVFLPLIMTAVFQQSEKSVEDWLDVGFDADTELLELINSGELSESHVGEYLHTLKERFAGPIVADLLCYLRIHVELALRAKGLLMMRDSGFEVTADEETRAKLEEMRFLEKSIGKTGKLALKPFLHMSRKDLWQFYILGK
ncbi:MAG: PrsW family intramembrane metalloprotease [Gammaproteobacteria bacterium]|nr:PrsW family intramembrane metalloprotease [Gammaproteobacteria bacterium]